MEQTTRLFEDDFVVAPEVPASGGHLGLGGKAAAATGHVDLIHQLRGGGIWVLAVLGFVVAVILVVNSWPRAEETPVAGTAAPAPVQTAPDAASDSLGIELPQLADRWNEVTSPPAITKGIPRTPETGRFDAFTYRFGESSLIAGAYDDRTEDLYGLLVQSWLSDENADRLVIHVCHVVHPHQPECLEQYSRVGLAGGTLEDFRDLTHQAEWVIDGITWRLEIEDNVQSIRVIAPGA
ncbi:MAG TPA: hypothetical protein VF246_08590 [Acidimicrobiia bacterium]